jgi:hypothetical protein
VQAFENGEIIRKLRRRSKSNMKQEIFAYLMQDNGHVSNLPIDELLGALEHLKQVSIAQEQAMHSNGTASFEFLQALKRAIVFQGNQLKNTRSTCE